MLQDTTLMLFSQINKQVKNAVWDCFRQCSVNFVFSSNHGSQHLRLVLQLFSLAKFTNHFRKVKSNPAFLFKHKENLSAYISKLLIRKIEEINKLVSQTSLIVMDFINFLSVNNVLSWYIRLYWRASIYSLSLFPWE